MTIKRAIEILSLEDTKVTAAEWREAHRMGAQALALLEPTPVKERHPESCVPVLGYAFGLYEGHAWLDGDWVVVEYEENQDLWTMSDDAESKPVQVSHWKELPPEPEMEEDDG